MGPGAAVLIAALLLWLTGVGVLGRIRRRGGNAVNSRAPAALSIVIPARNEEHNLPVLLRSIDAQAVRGIETIVVDDASTDDTARVARDLGATVITARPLPDGWRGKTWACQQGANAARSELLLFVDADSWFEPQGLERILSAYNGGALSVGPYHDVRKPYEQLSAFFHLIMAAGTVPHGLFGQFLLVDRESYQCVGGHAAVKGRILENFYLAERFREAGIATRSFTGRGVFTFRMYPDGLPELIEGWTKGFASGAGRTPKPLLFLLVAWLSGMMLAAVMLIAVMLTAVVLPAAPWASLTPWASLLYLLVAAQLGVMFREVGAFTWYTALLYPVPLLFYFIVFARSARRSGRQVTWKGRTILAD